MKSCAKDHSRKNLRVGVINEIHKLITQFNNDVITICHFTVQRSEQFSGILFDKTGHNFFWVRSMSRFELIFNNVNAARRTSPMFDDVNGSLFFSTQKPFLGHTDGRV